MLMPMKTVWVGRDGPFGVTHNDCTLKLYISLFSVFALIQLFLEIKGCSFLHCYAYLCIFLFLKDTLFTFYLFFFVVAIQVQLSLFSPPLPLPLCPLCLMKREFNATAELPALTHLNSLNSHDIYFSGTRPCQ